MRHFDYDLSVVISVRDEQKALPPVLRRLRELLDSYGKSYEVLVIDDGSRDETVREVHILRQRWEQLFLFKLREHLGKSIALQVGFQKARGAVVVACDGDGQNEPADIPLLLEKLQEGFEAVLGWRQKRLDSRSKVWASRFANRLRRFFLRDSVHDAGCGLFVIRSEVAKRLFLNRGLHRFLGALLRKMHYRISEVPVRHYARQLGTSKYGIWDRAWEGGTDLIRVLSLPVERLLKPMDLDLLLKN